MSLFLLASLSSLGFQNTVLPGLLPGCALSACGSGGASGAQPPNLSSSLSRLPPWGARQSQGCGDRLWAGASPVHLSRLDVSSEFQTCLSTCPTSVRIPNRHCKPCLLTRNLPELAWSHLRPPVCSAETWALPSLPLRPQAQPPRKPCGLFPHKAPSTPTPHQRQEPPRF